MTFSGPSKAAVAVELIILVMLIAAMACGSAYADAEKDRPAGRPDAEEQQLKMDRPLKRTQDVENGKVHIDIDFLHKTYKRDDGSNPYNVLPLLLRFDTGRSTEW